MNIEITKDSYGYLYARRAETHEPLFQFDYRTKHEAGPAWFFWLRNSYSPHMVFGKKKDFPMDFFVDACRAKSFLRLGKDLDDEVIIVSGKSYLK